MGGAFKIGRFSGIDVRVHWTFLLLLAFFAFLGYQASGSPTGALMATAAIVALFLCVLLHEFGHSLMAQRLGIGIHSITLLPIGGVSNPESLPEKPSDEVKISVAGPLVSVVLALIFFGASGEAQMVRQREQTGGLSVSDVMGTKPRTETVTPLHNFGQVLDPVIHGYQEDFPVVDEGGKLVGMITRDEIMIAAHSPGRFASVRDLMKTDIPTVSSQSDLFEDGLRILQESGLRALPVTENGELVGMLTIEDVGQARLLRPPPTAVSRIDGRATGREATRR